jgi:RNA polymerase sigma-70 factor, ECF subfamily
VEPQIHASPAGDGTSRPGHGDGVLEQLFARHSERIYRYCLREFGSREEAEDALQDTYVNALRSLRRGFEPQAPLAWLLTIAGNVCRSRRRSERARVRTEPLERLGDVASSEEPWNDEVAAISDALGRLPEMQRRAVLLREWRGLSYDEIADELSLSHSAVATQISRARRALSSFVLHPVRDRSRSRIPRSRSRSPALAGR